MKSFWELTIGERAKLAKDSPEEFDKLWQAELKTTQEQQTIWALQGKLNKIKNPLERCNQAHALMMESLIELNDSLNK